MSNQQVLKQKFQRILCLAFLLTSSKHVLYHFTRKLHGNFCPYWRQKCNIYVLLSLLSASHKTVRLISALLNFRIHKYFIQIDSLTSYLKAYADLNLGRSHTLCSRAQDKMGVVKDNFFLFLNENICCDPSLELFQ